MRIEVDDVRVACLGKLDRQLTEDEVDRLGRVDVFAVPVGGVDALSASPRPRSSTPSHRRSPFPSAIAPQVVEGNGDYDPLDKFAKEMGLVDGSWPVQPKLTLTGSMGAVEETRVVIVEPRAVA